MSGCKYKNYAELFAAYDSGELDKEKFVIMIDNDNIDLWYFGDDMDEEEAYEYCKTLFRGDGVYASEIIDILKAAGYPAAGV